MSSVRAAAAVCELISWHSLLFENGKLGLKPVTWLVLKPPSRRAYRWSMAAAKAMPHRLWVVSENSCMEIVDAVLGVTAVSVRTSACQSQMGHIVAMAHLSGSGEVLGRHMRF